MSDARILKATACYWLASGTESASGDTQQPSSRKSQCGEMLLCGSSPLILLVEAYMCQRETLTLLRYSVCVCVCAAYIVFVCVRVCMLYVDIIYVYGVCLHVVYVYECMWYACSVYLHV